MSNIFVRMGVVIGVLLVVQLGFQEIFRLDHPETVQPLKPLDSFPMEVRAERSTWIGKDAKLDDLEFNFAQLDKAVSRRYTNRDNRSLSLILGQYSTPSDGLYHNPFNCYRTHGSTLIEDTRPPLPTENRPPTTVSMSVWENEGQHDVVVFWYEVGDYTMFERQDLLPTQFAMRGKSKWPVMFKVLIDVPAGNDVNQAKIDALDMAASIRQWLGTIQPQVE